MPSSQPVAATTSSQRTRIRNHRLENNFGKQWWVCCECGAANQTQTSQLLTRSSQKDQPQNESIEFATRTGEWDKCRNEAHFAGLTEKTSSSSGQDSESAAPEAPVESEAEAEAGDPEAAAWDALFAEEDEHAEDAWDAEQANGAAVERDPSSECPPDPGSGSDGEMSSGASSHEKYSQRPPSTTEKRSPSPGHRRCAKCTPCEWTDIAPERWVKGGFEETAKPRLGRAASLEDLLSEKESFEDRRKVLRPEYGIMASGEW